MFALVKTKPGKGLDYIEVEKPAPMDDEVLIKVVSTGICGSDVHVYNWNLGYEWMEKYMPIIPGHEMSGIVVEKGKKVKKFNIGDRVVCNPSIGCGECDFCIQGLTSICDNVIKIGFNRNGSFAEYIALPEAICLKINKNVNFDIASLVEPLSVSAHAVERAGSLHGKKVAVLGCGTIGIGICYFANGDKAEVWTFGKEQDKSKFSVATMFGVKECINVDTDDINEKVKEIVGDAGFDVIFDTTGSSKLIEKSIDMIKNRGQLVAVGIYPTDVKLNLTNMVRHEKKLITSYCYSDSDLLKVLDIIGKSPLLFEKMITHKFNIKESDNAFNIANTHTAIKILFNF